VGEEGRERGREKEGEIIAQEEERRKVGEGGGRTVFDITLIRALHLSKTKQTERENRKKRNRRDRKGKK